MTPTRILLTLAAASGVLAVLQGLLFGLESRTPPLQPETAASSAAPTSMPADRRMEMGEHPDFPALVAHLEAMRDHHAGHPSGDSGYDLAFLYLLADYAGALTFEEHEIDTARDHAKTIARYRDNIDELEARYEKRQDLGGSVRITLSDGTVFEHDGRPADL